MYEAKVSAIRNAQVVCCTCIASGGGVLERFHFSRVLVDEATQATEPSTIVPLCLGAEQVVLVGDHCQLPPTVVSRTAELGGLTVPLFSRLVDCGVRPYLLDTQYRMHPAISQFPCDLFYAGRLKDGVSARDRPAPRGFRWPRPEWPVAMIPVAHGRESTDGSSKENRAEAMEAVRVVDGLLAGGLRPSEVGLITPYAAQVRLLRRLLRGGGRGRGGGGVGVVEVSSVDGFQGREKDVIVFSAVRANDRGQVSSLYIIYTA